MDSTYKGVQFIKLVKVFCYLVVVVTLLVGCFHDQTFEQFFHEEMESHGDRDERPYSLVYHEINVVHENDAVAIFEETNQNGEQIFIAYFEKDNGSWEWRQTRGAEWGLPVNWSHMEESPHIYSGATLDETIKEIYAGDEQADIIELQDEKRFWFAISSQEEVDVKFVMNDGTEKYIERIDYEYIESDYDS
ncbi:hypothetical protein ACM26V_03595 [Salipaludibacillus sp. HK11]|uniref:hypothetical protein n=1 Tax=Salipaludibacillus sp. HK11 TaxID=3394320 RepID=UPI0039FD16E9